MRLGHEVDRVPRCDRRVHWFFLSQFKAASPRFPGQDAPSSVDTSTKNGALYYQHRDRAAPVDDLLAINPAMSPRVRRNYARSVEPPCDNVRPHLALISLHL